MTWKLVTTEKLKKAHPTVGEKIWQALATTLPDALIRGVYKGRGWNGYGWYFRLFNKNPSYLGKNEAEALETIEQMGND